MPYYTTYTCETNNLNGQRIFIQFQKLMAPIPPGQEEPNPIILPLVEFTVQFMNGDEEKYNPVILSQKAIIKVRAKYGSVSDINNEMFYSNLYDEWKIIAQVDGKIVFQGFITNENEPYILKDKPYNIVVTATDGLGLLKNNPLTDINGNKFTGRNTLLSYVAGALRKTGLEADIRIYCNIYNSSMQNRFDIYSPDMFTQTRLHHRSLLDDSYEYMNCYDALEFILSKWCVLYQHQGDWVINTISEMQYDPSSVFFPYNGALVRYHTVYGYLGDKKYTILDSDAACKIGPYQKIQPIELDQRVSYMPPVKSVKTIYNYSTPSELINNEKLKDAGSIISPLSGSTYTAYGLVGWSHFKGQINSTFPSTAETPSSDTAYIKREFNQYNFETDRYYVVPKDSTAPSTSLQNYIRNLNTDFFVDKGDKITVTATFRTKNRETNNPNLQLCSLVILRNGRSGSSQGDWYSLDINAAEDTAYFVNNPASTFGKYNVTQDTTQWKTISFSELEIPEDGIIYLMLGCGGVDNGNEAHFKECFIEYIPYVKGSRLSVKSDYWLTSQNYNIKDTISEEINISDSPKRILTGALWDNSGNNLTTPTWYRLNYTESKHFKELANLGRYRSQYQRVKRISGTFKGVFFNPNGTTTEYPLAMHKHYIFENIDDMFMISTPLDIDYINCRWRGTLISVLNGSTSVSTEGNEHVFNYIFK